MTDFTCGGDVAGDVAEDVAADCDDNLLKSRNVADVADELGGREERANPEPDGAVLLDDIVAAIRRYVILDQSAASMCALWVMHAHTINAHQHSPRLAITSPIPNCGKTTLCSGLAQLLGVRVVSNATIAVFFRTIEKQGPITIILDEADTFLSAENRQGIGVLNSGHARAGAHVMRTERSQDGGLEPATFSTWAPVVFGLIGKLPAPALESRSTQCAAEAEATRGEDRAIACS